MLQPSDIRVPTHSAPSVHLESDRTGLLARSFYGMLKTEGFTPDQVIDLLLCLLDQVHEEASSEPLLAK